MWAVFGIGWKWITVWKWILDRFSLFGNGFLIGFCLEMDSLIGFPRSVHLDLLLLLLFLVTGNCSSVHEMEGAGKSCVRMNQNDQAIMEDLTLF